MLIYLDESGCLGFDFTKKGTSIYFTIAVLICSGKLEFTGFKKAVRRTLKNKIQRSKTGKQIQELKGSNTTIEVKKYFMRNIPTSGWGLYSITIDKRNALSHLTTKTGKVKLYNYLSRKILEKIPFQDDGKPVTLVLDKSKSKSEIQDFNQYFERQIQGRIPLNTPLNIYHEESHANAGLQAVDMFCWGIVRNRARGENEWHRHYSSYIEKDILFF